MWHRYLRWRHSKGFGVHSPYAFRFVKDVLRPGPYGLYSYQEIEKNLKGKEKFDYKLQNLIKFILRLAIFLKSKRIISSGNSRAVQIAAKALKIEWKSLGKTEASEFSNSDLLIVSKDHLFPGVLESAICGRAPILALDPGPKIRELLEVPIPKGLLLNDKKRIILIPRNEMEYVAYPMILEIG